MTITETDLLERTTTAQQRLRDRARHLPFGELDRKIMHETADLLEELKPKPKRKKKNVKS
jgi:hypothetical protein